jgi:hypothetical protein
LALPLAGFRRKTMPVLYRKRDAAKDLHDAGYWVVPCNGKVATKKDWPNERVDIEELLTALAENSKYDIAIVLGPSNLLDMDYDNGPDGETEVRELCGGEIPPTWAWDSPRGGHLIFRCPDWLTTATKIGNVEIRVGKRTVVVPPSAGRRRKAGQSRDTFEVAELPAIAAERIRAAITKSDEQTTSGDEIPEGDRNNALFVKACGLKDIGLPEETIAATLLDLNQRLCKPPLPEDEVRAIAHSAATQKPKVGFLERLLGDFELWHDENGDPFATIPQGEHRENWKIGKRVRAFRRLLSKLYYEATRSTLSDKGLTEIASLLEGRAVFDGPEYRLWRRAGEGDGKFYFDLCDDVWREVEIDAQGWRVVSNPPVKFFRARGMLALPSPVQVGEGESLHSLLSPFLNLGPTSWPLIAAWLVAALRPRGPYPILKLLGEQGSAKTTTARVLRELVDPNAAPVRAEPRSTRDLAIAANNAWVICMDNLSTVKPDLSDALCRLSTGGGFATRTLYTDEDETIFDATRPVILTSIEEIGTRSDLLERSLIIELPTISESDRKPEKQFWADFEIVRPRILGALLDAVSGAMRCLPEVEQRADAELSRLADFEQWAMAAENALGLAPGEFAEAYRANREVASQVSLESSPVVSALLKLLAKEPKIEATATTLLEKLGVGNDDRQPGWPKTPRFLSSILRRVAPNLRQIGITAVQRTEKNQKLWCIESGRFANSQDSQNNRPAPKSKSKMAKPLRKKKGVK